MEPLSIFEDRSHCVIRLSYPYIACCSCESQDSANNLEVEIEGQPKTMPATPESQVPSREDAKKKLQEGVESAQSAISTAGGFVTPIVDGLVDALGGVRGLLMM